MTTTSMHGGDIAIVGASETTEIGALPGTSAIDLHAEAARNALADAGRDIVGDGVVDERELAVAGE